MTFQADLRVPLGQGRERSAIWAVLSIKLLWALLVGGVHFQPLTVQTDISSDPEQEVEGFLGTVSSRIVRGSLCQEEAEFRVPEDRAGWGRR